MQRVAFETTVQYEPCEESKLSGASNDLSIGGLYLRTKLSLSLDETVSVSFSIPGGKEEIPITCKARVAWTNPPDNRRKLEYPPGVGLQFLDLSQKKVTSLAKFIDAYDEEKKMNVHCAWCGTFLGVRKGPFGTTSHGICDQCRKKID